MDDTEGLNPLSTETLRSIAQLLSYRKAATIAAARS